METWSFFMIHVMISVAISINCLKVLIDKKPSYVYFWTIASIFLPFIYSYFVTKGIFSVYYLRDTLPDLDTLQRVVILVFSIIVAFLSMSLFVKTGFFEDFDLDGGMLFGVILLVLFGFVGYLFLIGVLSVI